MTRWAARAGSLAAILAMALVIYLFGGELRAAATWNRAVAAGFSTSVALYVAAMLVAASVWKIILDTFGSAQSWPAAGRQVLISQIGKYVPGGVAQFLGRAAMTMKAGVPARTVGFALIAETFVTLVGGACAVAVALAFDPGLLTRVETILPQDQAWSRVALTLCAVVLALVTWLVVANRVRADLLPKIRLEHLAALIAMHVGAFLLLGASLHFIATAVSQASVSLSLSVAIFAAAWVVGFAVPGAPGGLGVRDSVIVLGLAPFMGGGPALSAALMHRAASVLGDVISLGVGVCLPKSPQVPADPLNERKSLKSA